MAEPMKTTLIAGVLVMLFGAAGAGQMPNYKVTSKSDSHTDFSRLKTYAWEAGWLSYDRATHERIVAAVDRELGALGFTKGTPEACDVTVLYNVLRRTDVDVTVKARTAEGRPTYQVGSLVVLLRDPTSRKELFRARADTPIELEPEKMAAIIDNQVAQMFARYPARRSNHR